MNKCALPVVLFAASCIAASAAAQTTDPAPAPKNATEAAKTDTQPAPAAPAPLVVFFDVGSTTLRNEDKAVLDHASRAYSEGKPIVMILTGTADRTGRPRTQS
jgi:outer membrane protein OmpA-like peptidoglycan-associated protein